MAPSAMPMTSPSLMGVVVRVLGILDCHGHLAGLHVGVGLGHRLDVLFEAGALVETEQGGERLGHAPRGNHGARRLGQLAGALGGHDDVLVVGQDDDGVGVHPTRRIKQVLRGRVHGLPAGHHHVHAQALEDRSFNRPRVIGLSPDANCIQ